MTPTDIDGLLKREGKDDLVARLEASAEFLYDGHFISESSAGRIAAELSEAAAEITRLREEVARLTSEDEVKRLAAGAWMNRAERAEAEVARATQERNIALAERHPDWSLLDQERERIAEPERELAALRHDIEQYVQRDTERLAEQDALLNLLRRWHDTYAGSTQGRRRAPVDAALDAETELAITARRPGEGTSAEPPKSPTASGVRGT